MVTKKWVLEEYSSIDRTWSTVQRFDSSIEAYASYHSAPARNCRVRLQEPEEAAIPNAEQVKKPIFHHPV